MLKKLAVSFLVLLLPLWLVACGSPVDQQAVSEAYLKAFAELTADLNTAPNTAARSPEEQIVQLKNIVENIGNISDRVRALDRENVYPEIVEYSDNFLALSFS